MVHRKEVVGLNDGVAESLKAMTETLISSVNEPASLSRFRARPERKTLARIAGLMNGVALFGSGAVPR